MDKVNVEINEKYIGKNVCLMNKSKKDDGNQNRTLNRKPLGSHSDHCDLVPERGLSRSRARRVPDLRRGPVPGLASLNCQR